VNVLDREGRHVRTLVPFAADIPPERIRALAPFQTADGDLVPQIHGYHQCSFYPLPPGIANGRSASTPDVFSPAVDGKGRVYWLTIGPHVACVDAKGGVPYETFLGPRLFADIAGLTLASIYTGAHGERPCLAVSGDDKWLYVSGLRVGDARKKADKPIPCVFRVNLETRGPAEVFLGRLDAPGTGEGQFVEPRGLAVADGLLYVADAGADPSRGLARAGRVVVFKEADRSRVGEVAVEAPDTVGARRRSPESSATT
jgi:hypothetical protein